MKDRLILVMLWCMSAAIVILTVIGGLHLVLCPRPPQMIVQSTDSTQIDYRIINAKLDNINDKVTYIKNLLNHIKKIEYCRMCHDRRIWEDTK